MRERFIAAMRYLLERLKEPSTHAGLVIILTGWIGVEAKTVSTEVLGGIIAIGAGTLLALLPGTRL